MSVVFSQLSPGWMAVESVGALEVGGDNFCYKVIQENGAHPVGALVVVRSDTPLVCAVRTGDGKSWRVVHDDWVIGRLASWPPTWA